MNIDEIMDRGIDIKLSACLCLKPTTFTACLCMCSPFLSNLFCAFFFSFLFCFCIHCLYCFHLSYFSKSGLVFSPSPARPRTGQPGPGSGPRTVSRVGLSSPRVPPRLPLDAAICLSALCTTCLTPTCPILTTTTCPVPSLPPTPGPPTWPCSPI